MTAQSLIVLSCTEMGENSIAERQPRFDINDDKAAAVIFETVDDHGMDFKGNIIGTIEKKDGKYIVYLANKSKKITIYSQGTLPTEIQFPDYGMNNGVLGGKTYCVTLRRAVSEKKDSETRANTLIFDSDIPMDRIIVNGEEWHTNGRTAKRLVPLGSYHYKIYAQSYDPIIGDIEVVNSIVPPTVKLQFNK